MNFAQAHRALEFQFFFSSANPGNGFSVTVRQARKILAFTICSDSNEGNK